MSLSRRLPGKCWASSHISVQQIYLWGLSAVGVQRYRAANYSAMGGGPYDYKLGWLCGLLKSDIERLSGNSDSMYVEYSFDAINLPISAEVPKTFPGFIDSILEISVVDVISQSSPSGKYLVVSPGWEGGAPKDMRSVRHGLYVIRACQY